MESKAKARGFDLPAGGGVVVPPNARPQFELVVLDVFRELIPLVPTLLYERERQRLIANLPPEEMPLDGSRPKPKLGRARGDIEIVAQQLRHHDALKPTTDAHGFSENNYARAARYLADCATSTRPVVMHWWRRPPSTWSRIVVDEQVLLRPVKTGIQDSQHIEILEGIEGRRNGCLRTL